MSKSTENAVAAAARGLFPAFAAVFLLGPVAAVAAEAVRWRTGVEFRRQLHAPVGVTLSANPLRNALSDLARDQKVAVFLDRRVDPDQKVDFSADNMPLEELLRRLAGSKQLGVCYVGPVVYVGPSSATTRLPTLAALRKEEQQKLPAEIRRRLAVARSWQWDDLATPRDLFTELGAQSKIRMFGVTERIPHDLWPATSLPPLPFADRMSLLAAGFGLTFEFSPDGTAVRLIPVPENATVSRTYTVGSSAAGLAAQLGEKFPRSKIRATGRQIAVVGPLEDHTMIARLLSGDPVRRPSGNGGAAGKMVFTLRVEDAPVGAILKTLANKPNIDVKYDPSLVPKLRQLVSVSVKEATLEEFLEATLEPAGLTYKRNGNTIEVVPK